MSVFIALNYNLQNLQRNMEMKPHLIFPWWQYKRFSFAVTNKLVDNTSSTFFGKEKHLALTLSLFCKSFCKAKLSLLVTQELFERCEWVIHLWAEVKRMLLHAQTHTHALALRSVCGWEAGAEGCLEPYEQPAGIFRFHSNNIIHTTICFSCVKKCFYGIRKD